jgi:hypothetical protein
MTALGREIVEQTRYNTIVMDVSGDLSFTYAVLPKNQLDSVGLAFVTKKKALTFARKTGNYGWKKQVEIYQNNVKWYNSSVSQLETDNFVGGKSFGYLPKRKAVKYLDSSYGDYSERLKRER